MEKHVNVVAALHIGLGIICAVIGITGFVVLSLIGHITDDKDAEFILRIIGIVAVIVLGLIGLPGIVAGLGLLKRKEWARVLTLIISAIELFNIPIGTAIGAYSIWTLVQDETTALFRSKS